MARRAIPLPMSLQRRAFTVAEALELGITKRSLERISLVAPHHGVRQSAASEVPSSYPTSTMLQRALTYRPRLRTGEAFSHTTALLLLAAPIHVAPSIHVTIARPAGQARGKGIYGHRSLQPLPIADGPRRLPCVTPEIALLQVAATLDFRELLVAIDAFVLERSSSLDGRPPLNLETLRRDAQEFHGPGRHRYHFALELARPGAESRMETLTRCEIIALGIEGFELQVNVCDDDGVWIGRFDLVDLARKLIIEYDGAQHQTDRAQYVKDQTRLNRVWQAGYRVLRLGREDFRHGGSHLARQKIDNFLGHLPRNPSPEAAKYLNG